MRSQLNAAQCRSLRLWMMMGSGTSEQAWTRPLCSRGQGRVDEAEDELLGGLRCLVGELGNDVGPAQLLDSTVQLLALCVAGARAAACQLHNFIARKADALFKGVAFLGELAEEGLKHAVGEDARAVVARIKGEFDATAGGIGRFGYLDRLVTALATKVEQKAFELQDVSCTYVSQFGMEGSALLTGTNSACVHLGWFERSSFITRAVLLVGVMP